MTHIVNIPDALVLTAGLGTRLRPLTLVRAKPAIPVAGEPLIRRIIRWVGANGITHLTLNLHHLPESITSVVGDGSDLDVRVRYSWEQPRVLGSAGGPRQALDIVGAETFFLINGDTLTDVDLRRMAEVHARSGALVTLALVRNDHPMQYGGVMLADDGAVSGFVPRGQAARGSFHFVGVQIASRVAFADIEAGQVVNTIGGCYDALIARRPASIRGFVTDARFWDIGTVRDYWHTSQAWSGSAEFLPSPTTAIDASAKIARTIFWDHVHVGEAASLEDCIVTDGVRVPPGTSYRKTILMRGADGTPIAAPLEID